MFNPLKTKLLPRRKILLIISILTCFIPIDSFGFWVVNFGTAKTFPPHRIGFAAGRGGQMVFLGNPQKTSAFFTIPHAGIRLGLTERLDVGLRLAPVPLPLSSVGPSFGINLDAKIRLTELESKVPFALVLGAGGAHAIIKDDT